MKRARLRTTHADEATAATVAAALAPDDTDRIETSRSGTAVVATIERETTGGLRATLDDYVVNCRVAAQLAERLQTDQP